MDELYTIAQAALLLKVHQLTIRRYIKEGRLKAVKVGGNIRILLSELKAFMQELSPAEKIFKNSHQFGSKPFELDDPLLSLKGRGLSLIKGERE